MEDRSERMTRLKLEVAQDGYRVDPAVVADALLARLRDQRSDRDQCLEGLGRDLEIEALYNECSYPLNLGASVKLTPPRPARTVPIHVRLSSQLRTAVSAMTHALGGTQTHSS
jgi:hypothetical protein